MLVVELVSLKASMITMLTFVLILHFINTALGAEGYFIISVASAGVQRFLHIYN
jgi:hypothetical protein